MISLRGGGSSAAMKYEIWRNYPVDSKVELVERLLERGVLHDEMTRRARSRRTASRLRINDPLSLDLPIHITLGWTWTNRRDSTSGPGIDLKVRFAEVN